MGWLLTRGLELLGAGSDRPPVEVGESTDDQLLAALELDGWLALGDAFVLDSLVLAPTGVAMSPLADSADD